MGASPPAAPETVSSAASRTARTPLRIGTRGSPLALFQANAVADLLAQRAGVETRIVVIKTAGDRLAEARLSAIGGKRLFVKEIEDALLAGDIDLAVHSSKDMPVVLPEGLEIGAALPREDARDAVVLPAGTGPPAPAVRSFDELRQRLGRAPRVGTSSVRRTAQLAAAWPEATFEAIRGNLDTRLRKLDEGQFDAIVLAAAGLLRLQHGHRISLALPVEACVPAPGQGIVAVEIRIGDQELRTMTATIDHAPSSVALIAERALVQKLGGGCQMPIGGYALVSDRTLSLTGLVASLDGRRTVRAQAEGDIAAPGAAGALLADRLMAGGAGSILAEVLDAQALADTPGPRASEDATE